MMDSKHLNEQILHDVREKIHKQILVPLSRWNEKQRINWVAYDRVWEQIGHSVMEDVVYQTMHLVRDQLYDVVRRSNAMWRRKR